MTRLPHPEPELALAGASGPAVARAEGDDRKPWGIIEID